MQHAEATLLIPDLLRRRLAEAERIELIEHMATCDHCRDLAESYEILSETLSYERAVAAAGHLTSEEVSKFVQKAPTSASADRARLAAHLRECPSCAADVRAVEQAHGASTAATLRTTAAVRRLAPLAWSGWRAGAVLAAGAAAVIVASLLLLRSQRIQRLESQIDDLKTGSSRLHAEVTDLSTALERTRDALRRVSEWSGAVGYLFLPTVSRGAAFPGKLIVDPGQPFAFIAAVPAIPLGAAADASFVRFVLDDALGRSVWQTELPRNEAVARLAASGSLLFQIPASKVPPGRYTFRVALWDGRSAAPLSETPFEVSLRPRDDAR